MPPEYPIAAGLADNKEPSDLKIFIRGNPYAFGEDAPRAFLQVLSDGDPKPFNKGSGRLELAEDIVSQPLALHIVNRVWRWNMGTGIVDTPNNFGFAGERPTNPQLLDYLTSKFVDEGMSPKKLIKEIVIEQNTRALDDLRRMNDAFIRTLSHLRVLAVRPSFPTWNASPPTATP